MKLILLILSKMANSVDPDQTAHKEQSDLGVHCLHMLFCQKIFIVHFWKQSMGCKHSADLDRTEVLYVSL